MKILQLCHKPPLPPVDGGCIAINSITQGLLDSHCELKVVAMATEKHPFRKEYFSDDYLKKTGFESIFVDTSIHTWAALKSLFTKKSYHVTRFISKEMTHKLINILSNNTFDIVQLESVFVAPYIPVIRQYSKAKIVLRTHNIEHHIWESIASHENISCKRLLLRIMNKHLKKYECSLFSHVDGFMAISKTDYDFFHQLSPQTKGVVIPFALNLDNYPMEDEYIPSDKPELFHLGSMNWLPNVEGINWFLDTAWLPISEKYPDVTFTVAGRNMPDSIKNRHLPNFFIEENVPDANQFMISKDIMIVPLLSGSGMRVKIIEGMALGKIIITTTVGADGIAVENGKNIFIADTPEDFLTVIEKCITTPDLCTIIGENARNFVALHHNQEVITDDIINFYRELLA